MSSNAIISRMCKSLAEKKTGNLFRITPLFSPQPIIDCASNSYLSFHTNSEVLKIARELTGDTFHGNLASRLVGQYSPLFDELESLIATWKATESALFFNSGYSANTGIIQAIATRNTEIYSDRLNHASIVDGIRLSGARMIRYHHNDMNHLKDLLKKSTCKEKLIITDSVFSMDGDVAPLAEICTIAEEYCCMLMVDEAHASGVFGKSGSGLAHELNIAHKIDIQMGTFSKALAGTGGFFAGSNVIRDFLVNNARSLIYSTGLPHSALAFNIASLQVLQRSDHIRKRVLDSASEVRKSLTNAGFDCLNSQTQIVPCSTETESNALDLSKFLRERSIIAPAIRPPTVPKGTARIRLSIHAGLSDHDLKSITTALCDWRTNRG